MNYGINNLIKLWSTKIRENLSYFFGEQKFLFMIDEIDKKIIKFESKVQLIQKKKEKEKGKIVLYNLYNKDRKNIR